MQPIPHRNSESVARGTAPAVTTPNAKLGQRLIAPLVMVVILLLIVLTFMAPYLPSEIRSFLVQLFD